MTPVTTRYHRCKECGKQYNETDALERFANMADDPLLVKQVLQVLAKRYGTNIQAYVCGECALTLAANARDAVTWQPDQRGHYVLSPTEEQYGRDTGQGEVITVARRVNEKEHTVAPEQTETEQTENWDGVADAVTETEPIEAGTPEAAATEPAKETRAERLAREWPTGQLVEFVKTEWKGGQGQITGVEDRRGVAYVAVDVEVYVNGRRRTGDAVKHVLIREDSVQAITEYRAEPAAAVSPEPVETETPAAEETAAE